MMNSNESDEPTVRTLIESAGKTQRQIGQSLNVTELSINNWATGRKLPRIDNFLSLCKELNVSPKTLAKAMRLDVSGIPDDQPPPTRPDRD
jgi:transcriptional regulator with XRE-family HTH domain